LSNNLQTGLGRSDNIDVFEVASSKGAADLNTSVSTGDGSFLEERCA